MNEQHRLPDPRMIALNRPDSWSDPYAVEARSTPDEAQYMAGSPAPDRRVGDEETSVGPEATGLWDREPAPPEDAQAEPEPVVRPFLMTGGRTTPLIDGLRIETLVRATPAALSAPLRFEQQRVAQLCQHPHSIAEIAAALHVPIGVARVLVSDLVTAGHASVHTVHELTTAAIERIRDLVRAL
jgi:hypothetical protein